MATMQSPQHDLGAPSPLYSDDPFTPIPALANDSAATDQGAREALAAQRQLREGASSTPDNSTPTSDG
jgi:hypothetical protein